LPIFQVNDIAADCTAILELAFFSDYRRIAAMRIAALIQMMLDALIAQGD